MPRVWREIPGAKGGNPPNFMSSPSRVDRFSKKDRNPRDEACRLEALKQGSVPCTWNAADFKFYFS